MTYGRGFPRLKEGSTDKKMKYWSNENPKGFRGPRGVHFDPLKPQLALLVYLFLEEVC